MKEGRNSGKSVKNKIINVLQMMIYSGCLALVIINMDDSTQQRYQSLRDIESTKALLYFAIFMCMVQKIKLFNWQSFIYTLLYIPLAYIYLKTHMYGADIEANNELQVCYFWLLSMVIMDMLVYKKYNTLKDFQQTPTIVYLLMTVLLIAFRHERNYPLSLIFPMMIFFMIPIAKAEWERIQNAFCNAWYLAFVVVIYRSIIVNPYDGTRWYGCFVNIGAFGMFLGCVFVVTLYRIFQCREKYGRKSIAYVLSWICMIPVVVVMLMVFTRTMCIGVLCLGVVYFVFSENRKTKKQIYQRFGLVCLAGMVLAVGLVIGIILLSQIDIDKLYLLTLEYPFLGTFQYIVGNCQYIMESVKEDITPTMNMGQKLFVCFDHFTSIRLRIWVEYAKEFSFVGNPSFMIQVGDYLATNAHNQYVQIIFEYGYFGGVAYLLWLFYTFIKGIKDYRKTGHVSQLLMLLWMPMILGLLLGEMVQFYYSCMFMTLVLLYPQMIHIREEISSE